MVMVAKLFIIILFAYEFFVVSFRVSSTERLNANDVINKWMDHDKV